MKTKYFKIASLALVVFFVNCSKDDSSTSTTSVVAMTDTEVTADVKSDLQIDAVGNDISDLVTSSVAAKGLVVAPTSCVAPVKTTETINGVTYYTSSFDFGATGCTQPNGNVLKGKVIAKISVTLVGTTVTASPATITFENFYHNDKMVTGTITSKTEIVGLIPTSTITQDIEVSLTDGKKLKRKGTITRAFSKGYDTKTDNLDDEFTTTGNWTTTFPDATTNVVVITKPLVIKIGCVFKKHVQGTISFNRRNGNTGTLDFGDGSCSPTWTITRTGKSPITITKD